MLSKHNAELRNLLKRIDHKVSSAVGHPDLMEALNLATEFGAPIKFDNKTPAILAIVLAFISICAAAYVFFIVKTPSQMEIILLVMLFIATGLSFAFIARRNQSVTKLSEAIFHHDLLLDNNLQRMPTEHYIHWLQNQFDGFSLGNHANEIHKRYEGLFEGEEHRFKYQYFHYHYVTKRVEEDPASFQRGRHGRRSRTVYDHYDRFGIIVPFDSVKGVKLSRRGFSLFGGSGYRTASNAFNKLFNVSALSEMMAAKFLKPRIVVEFEQICKKLQVVSYQFNNAGELCFVFKDKDLVWAKRRYGLESIELFVREIEGFTHLPKLNMALTHIHTLLKFSDNNFSETRTEITP